MRERRHTTRFWCAPVRSNKSGPSHKLRRSSIKVKIMYEICLLIILSAGGGLASALLLFLTVGDWTSHSFLRFPSSTICYFVLFIPFSPLSLASTSSTFFLVFSFAYFRFVTREEASAEQTIPVKTAAAAAAAAARARARVTFARGFPRARTWPSRPGFSFTNPTHLLFSHIFLHSYP